MEKLAVERSIWIAAPRERVWEAVTNPEQVVQWFVPNLPGAQMTRDEDGTVTIQLGPMEVNVLILEMTNPRKQASIRSLPERQLASTYTLADDNGGTRVTVTMTGFESLPEDAREDRLNLSGEGWEKALANLKAYVDGAELPYPQAYTGPLFGCWRETKERIAVERSIWINAPREHVWQAIVDPEQIEKWFSPGTAWRSSGEGVGSRIFVYNPETDSEMYTQVTDVFEPPRRLVTRSEPEPPEMPHVTDWVLEEENGGTRLTLTYSGYELEAGDVRPNNMEQNAFGFGMMLENLKAQIEGESLPYPGGF
jgi:uncharacterized protein YndB with AHSA1/START domain